MLQRKRAWDLLREKYVAISDDAGLPQVIKSINEGIKKDPLNNFALVFNKREEFKGVVSMWNVLQAMGPCLLKNVSLRGEVDWDEAFHGALRTCSQVGIRDLVQKDVPVIPPTEPLARVMEIFLDYRRGRAVVAEGGRVMGVVLLFDLYREVGRDVEEW
ncbi:MAG: CBS domain-containing protein [Desulfovibrionales bacterium]